MREYRPSAWVQAEARAIR